MFPLSPSEFLFLFYRLFWKTILFLFGPYESKDFQNFLSNSTKQKYVAIFPHSSKWESFWYVASCAASGRKACALCYYSFFQIPVFGSWLRWMGLIPVYPKRYGGEGSAVDKIVTELNKHNEFVFCISPQGGITAEAWKSGYYHIAKETGAKIVIIGLDYETQTMIYIDKEFDPKGSNIPDLESQLMYHMRNIMVARPTCSNPRPRMLPGSTVNPLPINVAWISYVLLLLCCAISGLSSALVWFGLLCYGGILHLSQIDYILKRQYRINDRFGSNYTAFLSKSNMLQKTATAEIGLIFMFFAISICSIILGSIRISGVLFSMLLIECFIQPRQYTTLAYLHWVLHFLYMFVWFPSYSLFQLIALSVLCFIVKQNLD